MTARELTAREAQNDRLHVELREQELIRQDIYRPGAERNSARQRVNEIITLLRQEDRFNETETGDVEAEPKPKGRSRNRRKS